MKSHSSEMRGLESAALFKALSSDTRRGLLQRLQKGPMTIGALTGELGVSRSSVARHIKDLSDAGLVTNGAGHDGQKTCRLRYERVVISFEKPPKPEEKVVETETPIGLYTHVEALPPCGLASSTGIIGSIDDPQCFVLPDRAAAQLLWIGRGYVEYAFPNPLQTEARILRLELAMEICSELALHRRDYPSDVTVWINGRDIGTWTSFGGLGETRGRLTPAWWWDTRTQYGMMKVWSVDTEGAYVDGSPLSAVSLSELNILPHAPITVRIGTKPGARNIGNINLFGRHFGNYEQDMVLRLLYSEGTRTG